jgi:hypothetical protein
MDSPGRVHAGKVAQSLSGTAASVKIVELPGLPEKGDISDFIELRKKADRTPEAIKEELLDIIENTTEYVPDDNQGAGTVNFNDNPLIILGKTNQGKILLYSKDTRITHEEDRRGLDRTALIDLCGLKFGRSSRATT